MRSSGRSLWPPRPPLTPRATWRTVSGVTALELLELSKSFGGRRVIDALTCRVESGEFFVLLGPSGCGKTTTLRLIAGLERPDSGEIRLDGRSASTLAPGDRGIGMVFQSSALYPHMTVSENLDVPLRAGSVRGTAAAEARRRIAELLDLGPLLLRPVEQLSGGERQRAALGRALVASPSLLLLDEPFASLDPPLRQALRRRLRDLHVSLGRASTRATTTVHVTHDQEEAMCLADRIAVVRRGAIVQCGTPRELYERPANRFVAEFIGSAPMNFVTATLDEDGLVLFGQRLPIKSRRTPLGTQRAGPVVVGIRPEEIEIGPRIDGEPLAHVFPATVRTVQYLGGVQEVRLEVVGSTASHVAGHDLPPTQGGGACLLARVPASRDVGPGDEVGIRIPPEKLHLFEANAGDPNEGRRLG